MPTDAEDDAMRHEAAGRLRAMAPHHRPAFRSMLLGVAGWMEYVSNFDDPAEHARASASARALLGATDTTPAREVCSKCGTAGCIEDARSGWYADEPATPAEVAAADELTAHDQAIGIDDDQTPRPRNHNALTITTLPKPVTGECSCGASAQFDFEGEADAWWTGHRQAEGIPGDEWGEWCPVHNEEMQDHDCDLVDTTEEPTDV